MNYEEALSYMYDQLPMYHRIGAAAYKPGLDNTYALLDLVNNPQEGMRTVHIAGTNGKGSTSHLIASALQEAGFKTGLYTSPHLKDFRERIRINGEMIPKEKVVAFVVKHQADWEKMKPSFFEITVAMCFWYFNESKVDIAVIETGLGGRLDSTNVILPEVSVITNIGMDHMSLLGDTIEKIATEKAGIIKQSTPVVIGKMRSDAKKIMVSRCVETASELVDSDVPDEKNIPSTPLLGLYQTENRKTAFATLSVLQKKNWNISNQHISDGFHNVISNTSLMGRWQILQQDPLIILDVAHNEDGIRYVTKQIGITPYDRLHFVLGVVNDKDLDHILELLPKDAIYYFCKANIPRGLDAEILKQKATKFQLFGTSFDSVDEAFQAAKKNAGKSDLIFVGGSFFTVAEVL